MRDFKKYLMVFKSGSKVQLSDSFTAMAEEIKRGTETQSVKVERLNDLKAVELISACLFYSKQIYFSAAKKSYNEILLKFGEHDDIKVLFLELVKLSKIQAKKRMLELRAAIGVFLLFMLASLQKTTLLQTSTQAYQTPPSKLFTQAITNYTHTLSRP